MLPLERVKHPGYGGFLALCQSRKLCKLVCVCVLKFVVWNFYNDFIVRGGEFMAVL